MQAAPMARLQQRKQAAVTTGTPQHHGIPCAMVLRLIRDLPGVPGLIATVALRNVSQSLTPASGCQDHTTSPSASARFVSRAKASIASRANTRDDRVAPLLAARDASKVIIYFRKTEALYFSRRGLTFISDKTN
jgi:hypothetical protein